MSDPRQNSDTVVYDRDGNIVRVIHARKRVNRKERELARKRALAKMRSMK